MKTGNLGPAIDAVVKIKELVPQPSKEIHSWLSEAKARLFTERAIAKLHVSAISLMAQANK